MSNNRCACSCVSALGNLGLPGCDTHFGITTKMFLVPLAGSDGSLNYIDTSVPFNQALLDAKRNAVDGRDRWYPTPIIENIEPTIEDPTFETTKSGSKYFIKDGIIAFKGEFLNVGMKFVCKLQANKCTMFGVYLVDECNNLMGLSKSDDGKLYPIPVQAFNAKPMFKSNDAVSKAMFSFEFKRIVGVCSLEVISSEYIDTDIELLDVEGLLDVNLTLTNTTLGQIVGKLTLDYGSFGNKIPVTGETLAEIVSLTNLTQNIPLTVVSVTESTSVEGEYTIVYTPSTTAVGDVLQLVMQDNGYDFLNVKNTTITVA